MKQSTLVLFFLFLLAACRKEPARNTGWSDGPSEVYPLVLSAPQPQQWTRSATGNFTLTSSGGIVLRFGAYPFQTADGSIIADGPVDVRLSEMLSNEALVYAGGGTVSRGDSLLHAAGVFELRASREGLPVMLRQPVQVSVPYYDFYPAQRIWTAGAALSEATNPLQWRRSGRDWGPTRDSLTYSRFYTFYADSLQWWSVAHAGDASRGYSRLRVELPADFGSLNTQCILLLKGGGAANLIADRASRQFYSPLVPAGADAVLLCISKKGGVLQYHRRDFTIGEAETYSVPGLNVTTEAELKALIRDL